MRGNNSIIAQEAACQYDSQSWDVRIVWKAQVFAGWCSMLYDGSLHGHLDDELRRFST